MEDLIKISVQILEIRDIDYPVEINSKSELYCEVSFDNQKHQTRKSSCMRPEWTEIISGELSFSANDLVIHVYTIVHRGDPPIFIGSLILPIDELFTGEAFDHWLEITREDSKLDEIYVGELHLHIEVKTKLYDSREVMPRLERRGSLRNSGVGYRMMSSSSSEEMALKSPVPSLNLSVYTSSETSVKPSLSFVLASSRGNISAKNGHALTNSGNDISQETEAMIAVLSKYKCKSTGSLAVDVSSTIVECFKTLLQRSDLQNHFAEDIRDFAETRKSICPEANILEEYCELKFSEQIEGMIIDKIIASGQPSATEMREVVQSMVIFILNAWGFPHKIATSYAHAAFTKRYEDGILNGISLTGWGKKMFPLWHKVVLATGVTVYTCLKDTYLQYIMNYIHDGRAILTKLPNPDYYGRLGGACFDTLVHKMKKIKTEEQQLYLNFIFRNEFSITKPSPEKKICVNFLKHFTKLEQPYNKEKYISAASTTKVSIDLESTTKMVLRESIKQSKKMQRSQTTRSWNIHSSSGSSPSTTSTRRSSLSSKSTENSADVSTTESESSEDPMDNNRIQEQIRKLTEKMLSGNNDVVYSKREGISLSRNNSKLDRQFQLFIVEPSLTMCIHLYNYFHGRETVNIINGSYTQLDDEYDCLAFTGNAFGLSESNRGWMELEGMFGSHVIHKIRSTIVREFMGELPIGHAILLKTNHPKVRLLVYSAGYQLKETAKILHCYTCLWTVFMTVYKYNERKIKKIKKFRRESGEVGAPKSKQPKFDLIKTVVYKGNYSKEGDEVSAQQIFYAWDQFNFYIQNRKPVVENWADAVIYGDKTIINKEPPSTDEKKRIFDGLLISGALERRGFIDHKGVGILCEYLLDPEVDEFKMVAAASALSAYAFPERLPGIRDMIFQKGCLEPLLKLASRGKLSVHNEISPLDVTIGDHIADGATGRVHKGKWKEMDVAVKVSGENFLGFSREEFLRELSIMSMLRHKNVLLCLGASTLKIEELLIVTEWITNGTLRNLLDNTQIELTWPMQMSLASQIAKGMEFIHSMHLIHCDIKSHNIMLGDNLVVKIIDFGNSRIVGSTEGAGALGTTQWMAQEILAGSTYTQKADIYSYGIVLWEIITRKLPFEDMQLFDIPSTVMRGERPAIPKDCPSRFAQLIQSCWQPNPSKRPSFVQVNEELSKIGEEYHLYI